MATETSWADLDGFQNDANGANGTPDDEETPHARARAVPEPHTYNQINKGVPETVWVMAKQGAAKGREALADMSETLVRNTLGDMKRCVRARVRGAVQGPVEVWVTEINQLKLGGAIVMHQKAEDIRSSALEVRRSAFPLQAWSLQAPPPSVEASPSLARVP